MAFAGLSKLVDKARVHPEEGGRVTDRWTNPDILPVLPENRTFNIKSYFGFWVAAGIAAVYWTMGSTAIANGLSAAQAIGAMIVGAAISCGITWGCSEFGIKYALGFPMLSRAVFGIGIQSYWGGLAMSVILSSRPFTDSRTAFPRGEHSMFPAHITTKDFIGTMIYFVIFTALMFVKPYKLQPFFITSFIGVSLTILGMFIWAMAVNGGVGDVVAPTAALSTGETVFQFVRAVCSLATTYTGVSIRHSDWTRYSARPRDAHLAIWIACPLVVIISSTFGILVTSAVRGIYGEIIWQPITLLAYIQDRDYSATTRAGTFFAGVGWFLSQMGVNVSSNAVATGMDLASIIPEFINVRRGSLILVAIALATCPWNLVNNPGTFITVISSLGIFISPLIGIYIADYTLVRYQKYKVSDLYRGDRSSIYWYQFGFHWRSFLTWICLIWMSLPGFAAAIDGFEINVAWERIFGVSFLIGLVGGFVIYLLICTLSPVPGADIYEPWSVVVGEADHDGSPRNSLEKITFEETSKSV
ncbi:uncharacterized protein LTR77_000006 [Saxophila tyrrhenica]|uniref:Uncharacterized protein n=1 Tax=Saxophila tyrrhenica TaxID=1690608 RepID=A0AAV9PMV8_9PEZI|nr:hypothetical protein LTR77_000006 [Saxophila tyrrhenica]